MPQTPAPRPPRKWPYVLLVAAFSFAAPVAGFMGLVDFGAHIDGPGIGYSPTQLVAPFLLGVAVLAFVAVLLLAARWPWARWRAILPGMALAVAFVTMGAPLALLHASWRRACASGSAEACDAVARTKPRGDPARAELERVACRGGVWSACDELLETGGAGSAIACDKLVLTCATCIHHLCDVPTDTYAKARATCPGAAPPLTSPTTPIPRAIPLP